METTETTKLAGADAPMLGEGARLAPVEPKAPARPILVVQSQIAVFDTAMFEHMQRLAIMIASSNLVPEHLNMRVKLPGQDNYRDLSQKEAISNCFLVVNQAHKWGMDPFSLAQGVFVTKGKVGYEGKVIATVVNSHPQMSERLKYTFTGEFANGSRKVLVSGRLKGENEERTVEGSVRDWATDNGGWKKATSADQMLTYRGAREWGRRHLPEALMGVYADEEIEQIDRELGAQPQRPATHAGEAESATPASRTAGLAADLASRTAKGNVTDAIPADKPDIANLKPGEGVDLDTGEITKTPPSEEGVRLAIESANTQDELQPILAQMTALPNTPERAVLMKLWNTRVMALKKPAADDQRGAAGVSDGGSQEPPAAEPAALHQPAREPSPGPDPWAEPLKKALGEIAEAKSADALDTIMDRQNSVKWPPKLKKQIMAEYTKARASLS